jgi:hypothetical protein
MQHVRVQTVSGLFLDLWHLPVLDWKKLEQVFIFPGGHVRVQILLSKRPVLQGLDTSADNGGDIPFQIWPRI